MAELVSAYPTAGGIYWWASKLGGPGWGWFTGWFNLLGLIGVLASVDYFAGAVPGASSASTSVNVLGLELRRHRARAAGDVPAVRAAS